jgi:hypothetical protein
MSEYARQTPPFYRGSDAQGTNLPAKLACSLSADNTSTARRYNH